MLKEDNAQIFLVQFAEWAKAWKQTAGTFTKGRTTEAQAIDAAIAKITDSASFINNDPAVTLHGLLDANDAALRIALNGAWSTS